MIRPRTACILICLATAVAPVFLSVGGAETRPVSAPPIDFARDIQPIFEAHCHKCHGPEKRRGGLLLTNRRAAFFPAESGNVAIVPGQAQKSPLVQHVTSRDVDDRMPPKGKP
ncbi:MAG: hypothetical protein OER86_01325, partial [Phycisphaerae bacterium]|nr:hypothetical protein [Phycisphaerae bacterium]